MSARPLVLIYQELEAVTVSASLPDLNCLFVGPAYARWPYATKKSDILAGDYGDLDCEAFGLRPAGPQTGTDAYAGDLPQRVSTDRGDPESVDVIFDELYAEICHGTAAFIASNGTDLSVNPTLPPKRQEGVAPNADTDFVTADLAAGDTVVLFPAYEAEGALLKTPTTGIISGDLTFPTNTAVFTDSDKLLQLTADSAGDFSDSVVGMQVNLSGMDVSANNGRAWISERTDDLVKVRRATAFTSAGETSASSVVSVVRNFIVAAVADVAFDDIGQAGDGFIEIAGVGAGYDGVHPVTRVLYSQVGATLDIAFLDGIEFPGGQNPLTFKVFGNGALATDNTAKTATLLGRKSFASGSLNLTLNNNEFVLASGTVNTTYVGSYIVINAADDAANFGSWLIIGTSGVDTYIVAGCAPATALATDFVFVEAPVLLSATFATFDSTDVGNYLCLQEEFDEVDIVGNKITAVSDEGYEATLTTAPGDIEISAWLARARVQTLVRTPITAYAFELNNSLTSTYAATWDNTIPVPFHAMQKLDDITLPSTDWTYDDPQDNYVTIDGGRTTVIENFPRVIVNAEIYIAHRDLKKDSTTLSVQSIANTTDITTKVGDIDPENPLGLLTAVGFSNTSTSVQALGVNGDNLEDSPDLATAYLAARDTVSSRKDIYAIVPATIDSTVLAMWKVHVEAMADPEKGRFRMVIGAWELPAYRPLSLTPTSGGSLQGGLSVQETTAPGLGNTWSDDTADVTGASLRWNAVGTGSNSDPEIFELGDAANDGDSVTAATIDHSQFNSAVGGASVGSLVLVTDAGAAADLGLYVVLDAAAPSAAKGTALTGSKALLQTLNGAYFQWTTPAAGSIKFALFNFGARAAGNEDSVLNGANLALLGAADLLVMFDLIPTAADLGKWFNIANIFLGGASVDAGKYRVKTATTSYDTVAAADLMAGTPVIAGEFTWSLGGAVIDVADGFIILQNAAGGIITVTGAGSAADDGDWVIASVADGGGDVAEVTISHHAAKPAVVVFAAADGGSALGTIQYGIAAGITGQGLIVTEFEELDTATNLWASAAFDQAGTDIGDWGQMLESVLHETAVDYTATATKVYGEQDNHYQNRVDDDDNPLPGDYLVVTVDSRVGTTIVGTYEILKVNGPKELEVLATGTTPIFPDILSDAGDVVYYIMRDTNGDGVPDTPIVGTVSAPIYAHKISTPLAADKRFTELRNAYASFVTDGVAAGDRLEILAPIGDTDVLVDPWDSDDDFVTLYVSSVINENRLVIDTSSTRAVRELPSIYNVSAQAGRANLRYRVRRALTKSTQIDYLEAYSASFDSKRVVLVWPDSVELGSLASGTHEGFFLAAAVGGMIAGLPPQQPLTNLGIAAVSRVFNSWDYFSDDELTEISNAGWMVFIQDNETSLPYSVHQLTSHQSGVFDYEEISIVKTFDFVALSYKARLDPLVGKFNLVPDTVDLFRSTLNGVTATLRSQSYPFLGAPLTNASIASLQQLSGTQDRLECEMSITYPRPLNRFGLHLVATA